MAELREKIERALEESKAPPDLAATILAAMLGSVCREGCSDIDVALMIARLAAQVRVVHEC